MGRLPDIFRYDIRVRFFHILSEVKAVCDKALILSQGHLVAVVDLAAEERDLEELFLELTAPEETSDKKED